MTNHTWIRAAVLKKLHQPFSVGGIEEPGDVCIEHSIYLSAGYRDSDSIQRIVRVADWSEAVGETEEICFVDRTERLHRGSLDDLVF